jgi:enoyl-CoA hydratase
MTSANATPEPELIVREVGSVLHVTLNRARAVNALSPEMMTGLARLFETVDNHDYAAVLLDGAGDRGFCGGGDVKQVRLATPEHARSFLTDEYRADLLTNIIQTPVVGFMTGITMGGGIGLTGHAPFRIVSENSVLAMPETRIGLSPDVGGDVLLAQAPGRFGEYLATTSATMTAGDALALGFADVFVPENHLPELKEALTRLRVGESPATIIDRFVAEPPPAPLLEQQSWIDECFGTDSLIETVQLLEAHSAPEAREAAELLRQVSPISAVVSFWAVRLARLGDDLATVLERDLRVLMALLDRYDAKEGIRALLVDKDQQPSWNPARIEDVTVAQLVDVLGAEVLELVTENRV